MKIGVRAHDYGKRDIEELAALLHDEDYNAAQLALPKAFMGIDRYEDITMGHIEKIREAFARNMVEIPVFGCYMDLGNQDPQVREYAVKTLKQCLFWGKELGAAVVGTETAYPHLDPENRQKWKPYMTDSVLRVLEEAQRIGMKLAIEPVYWHPLADLETTLEIIRKADDPSHLRLIFDASNLLEFPESTDQGELWEAWLKAVGEYVDVMHIKDFSLGKNRFYQPEPLGQGVMRYEAVSAWLREQEREIYLLREEMNPLFAKDDLAFMRKL